MSGKACWALQAVLLYAFLVGFAWFCRGVDAHASDSFGNFQPLQRKTPQARSGAERAPASERSVTYQKIERTEGGYNVKFGFRNFNKDPLEVEAFLSGESVAQSIAEFGYRQSDFDDLDKWYQTAQKTAIRDAEGRMFKGKVQAKNQAELDAKLLEYKRQNSEIQSGLDKELARLAGEYRARRMKIYKDAGFRFKSQNVVEADIPALAVKNWRRVRAVAQSFSKIAGEKEYESEDLVGAAAAWVQTALRYEIPDTKEGSRVIAGVLPPMKALILGQGDCDTKSALLATVLLNWPNIKMVGLGIPGHYLMAVHRIPRRGEVFIEHEGIAYVMIESAGPAWLAPGTVGDQTLAYLQGGNDFRIQPIAP